MPVADPADVDAIDVQGLAHEDRYIWVVGSHSVQCDKPTSKESAKDARKQFARVSADSNRYPLARVSVLPADGSYRLANDEPPQGVSRPDRDPDPASGVQLGSHITPLFGAQRL